MDKALKEKMTKANELQKELNDLNREIETYLDDKYQITDDYVQVGNWVNPYCVDGICPIKPYNNQYDLEQIEEIIAFHEEFYKENGEYPDENDVIRHFEEKEQDREGR